MKRIISNYINWLIPIKWKKYHIIKITDLPSDYIINYETDLNDVWIYYDNRIDKESTYKLEITIP